MLLCHLISLLLSSSSRDYLHPSCLFTRQWPALKAEWWEQLLEPPLIPVSFLHVAGDLSTRSLSPICILIDPPSITSNAPYTHWTRQATLIYRSVAVLGWSHVVATFPLNGNLQRKGDVNPALVPTFGWQAGINPDDTGSCDGAVNSTNGKPILVPCQCPPNSTFFLATLSKSVAVGFVTTNPTIKLTFPTDNSTASQLARLNAAAVTLQNLEGPGVGCSLSSTTFYAQHKAITVDSSNTTSLATPPTIFHSAPAVFSPNTNVSHASGIRSCPAGTTFPSPSPSVTNTTSAGSATTPTDAQTAALTPPLGWKSGINPGGTGNCDGAVNGTDGKPILIPCQCPPEQTHYISNLTANIRAGHAVLNPSVLLMFPVDSRIASQNARLTAAAVTIQNLNGPGIGCPLVSTSLKAQSKAINAKSSH